MDRSLFALLVHDRRHCFELLRESLKALSVETFSVRTCADLARLIPQAHPHLIFSDVRLPDGTWVDVLNLAEQAEAPANVIVVGANQDIKFYASVVERGAFGLVIPPFEGSNWHSTVNRAGRDALLRRQAASLAPAA